MKYHEFSIYTYIIKCLSIFEKPNNFIKIDQIKIEQTKKFQVVKNNLKNQ